MISPTIAIAKPNAACPVGRWPNTRHASSVVNTGIKPGTRIAPSLAGVRTRPIRKKA
jgi:hypothetical protein